MMRERIRFVAVMPESAWRRGQKPRERVRRRDAYGDLAAGVQRHLLAKPQLSREEAAEWAYWAFEVGAMLRWNPVAPDGSSWYVKRRWDLV